jgi:hypothetical protein
MLYNHREQHMSYVIHSNQTIDITIPANRDRVRREMAEQGIDRLDTIDGYPNSLTALRRHDACTYAHNLGDDCTLCDALIAAANLARGASPDPLGAHRRRIAAVIRPAVLATLLLTDEEEASAIADREVRAFMRAVASGAAMPEKLLDYVK